MKFIGTGESTLSRADVVKRMWEYIKKNDLQVLFVTNFALFSLMSSDWWANEQYQVPFKIQKPFHVFSSLLSSLIML